MTQILMNRRTSPGRISTRLAVLMTVVAALMLSAPLSVSAQSLLPDSRGDQEEALDKDPMLEAFAAGNYDRARTLSQGRDDAVSLLIRAKLAEFDNDLELAERFAKTSAERATGDDVRDRAVAKWAHLEAQRGNWQAAEKRLREYLAGHATSTRGARPTRGSS